MGVHKWSPSHANPLNRSHTDKTILLIKLGDKYVPIPETAVEILPSPDVTEGRGSKRGSLERGEREYSLSDREKSNSLGERSRSEKEKAREGGVGSRSLMSVDSSRSLAGIPSISVREEEELNLNTEGRANKVLIERV